MYEEEYRVLVRKPALRTDRNRTACDLIVLQFYQGFYQHCNINSLNLFTI
jgi:hypothetical protein